TVVLIILMSLTTFTTQRQLMTKNMPASALDNPFARQQKLLLYVLPIVFAVSGINFPIGVLIYWFTTNLWSMAQQFYVIRRMPAPGSAAEKAYHARLERKGKPVPGNADTVVVDDASITKPTGQRAQPKSKKRKKASSSNSKRPAPPSEGSTGTADGTPPATT
ncbi:MAG: YidC/Oxa1 family membrane protein insertase, partial [Dermatophilaceae bacterium]